MKNLRIGYKIFGFLAVIIAMIVVLGGFALQRIALMDKIAEEIRTDWMQSVAILGQLQGSVSGYRITQARRMMTEDAEDLKAIDARLAYFRGEVQNGLTRYAPTVSTPAEREMFERLGAEWSKYVAMSQTTVDPAQSGRHAEAVQQFNTVLQKQFRTATGVLDELSKLNAEGAAAVGAQGRDAYETTKIVIGAVLVASILLAIAAWAFLHTAITIAVKRMTAAMLVLAKGDLSVVVPDTGRKDEIGQMADAVLIFQQGLTTAERLAREKSEADAALERKRVAMEDLTRSFVEHIDDVVSTVSAAASEMLGNAGSLSATAEETARQTTAVAAASDQASSNVQTVASAAEELHNSIAEISRQIGQAAQVAETAVTEAEQTDGAIAKLSAAAQKIGEVVSLITSIAGQTNLLALNATIEAARAGDAGKGFAVVASEVKSLAAQTARATGEIQAHIGAIQEETQRAVGAIQQIGGTIKTINGITVQVAAAVEEQDAATREIARNVQQAALGANEVSRNISEVTKAADETGEGASMVRLSANELSKQAEVLRTRVDAFVASVRAA